MAVVRRTDDDRVDVLLLVEHATEVTPAARPGELLEIRPGILLVDIAQCHDVFTGDTWQVQYPTDPPLANADQSDVEFLTGGPNRGCLAQGVEARDCGCSSTGEEVSSGQWEVWHDRNSNQSWVLIGSWTSCTCLPANRNSRSFSRQALMAPSDPSHFTWPLGSRVIVLKSWVYP